MMDDLQTAFDRGFEAVKQYVDAELRAVSTLPPELAEQVAGAVRMLHEVPPLEQRTQPSMPLRVTRIERDGDGFRVTHES